MAKLRNFSLLHILNIQKTGFSGKVWKLVVAATIWSIWLSRNGAIFRNIRITRGGLHVL